MSSNEIHFPESIIAHHYQSMYPQISVVNETHFPESIIAHHYRLIHPHRHRLNSFLPSRANCDKKKHTHVA